MCGRFAQAYHAARLQGQLSQDYPDLNAYWADENDRENYQPRQNVSPRCNVPVIRQENGQRVLRVMNWGLIPHWTKHEPAYKDMLSTTNARSESLTGEEPSGMWSNFAFKQRCIIPVQGFFEWLNTGGKNTMTAKKPYFTRNPKLNDGEEPPMLMMAGLWDTVTYQETETPIVTFTILTTSSSSVLHFLHTRMPVLLRTEKDMKNWLDCEPSREGNWGKDLMKLLKPFGQSKDDLTIYQVPSEVNKVGTQSESFLLPVSERKDGIESFFKKQTEKNANASASSSKASPPSMSMFASSPKPKPGSSKSATEKPSSSTTSSSKRKTSGGGGEGTTVIDEEEEKEKVIILSDEDDEIVPISPPRKKQKPGSATVD